MKLRRYVISGLVGVVASMTLAATGAFAWARINTGGTAVTTAGLTYSVRGWQQGAWTDTGVLPLDNKGADPLNTLHIGQYGSSFDVPYTGEWVISSRADLGKSTTACSPHLDVVLGGVENQHAVITTMPGPLAYGAAAYYPPGVEAEAAITTVLWLQQGWTIAIEAATGGFYGGQCNGLHALPAPIAGGRTYGLVGWNTYFQATYVSPETNTPGQPDPCPCYPGVG